MDTTTKRSPLPVRYTNGPFLACFETAPHPERLLIPHVTARQQDQDTSHSHPPMLAVSLPPHATSCDPLATFASPNLHWRTFTWTSVYEAPPSTPIIPPFSFQHTLFSSSHPSIQLRRVVYVSVCVLSPACLVVPSVLVAAFITGSPRVLYSKSCLFLPRRANN